jgi:hypothetical protein
MGIDDPLAYMAKPIFENDAALLPALLARRLLSMSNQFVEQLTRTMGQSLPPAT